MSDRDGANKKVRMGYSINLIIIKWEMNIFLKIKIKIGLNSNKREENFYEVSSKLRTHRPSPAG